MTIWLDNHLPPALSGWMRATLGVDCISVRDLTLQRAADLEIFHAARAAGALVMTKDADFAELVYRFGAPPQIVLVTCGNTSNVHLRQVLATAWPTVALYQNHLRRHRGQTMAIAGHTSPPTKTKPEKANINNKSPEDLN